MMEKLDNYSISLIAYDANLQIKVEYDDVEQLQRDLNKLFNWSQM